MGVLVVYLIILLIIVLTVKYLQYISFSWKIPSAPYTVPFLGHFPLFFGKTSKEIFWTIHKVYDTTERMTKLVCGHVRVILVHHPELLQKILTNHELYDKPFFYEFMKLGRGLITNRSGLSWKQTRKAVNPSFNLKILNGFIPMFDARTQNLVSKLQPLADGATDVNLLHYTLQCSLEMIFSTTMGCKLEDRPHVKEYVDNLERVLISLGKRMFNVEMFLEPLYKMSSSYKEEMKAREFCNEFSNKIIQERRQNLANENNNATVENLEQRLGSNVFLDEVLILKYNGKPLSEKAISDQVYTMMSAGNETSALTVSYACLFLAQHPEIQDKVVAEMQEVFHAPSVEINVDSLRQLQYTDMVIKETLRLVPVVPLVARETGTEIELDGVRIPKGQILGFNFFNLHRRKDFWGEDPEQFDPERFQPEAVRDRHPYAYLPFSGGFRNCIGGRYAMIAVKVMLTRLLMAFEVRSNIRRQDMRYKLEISLKLVGPHTVQLSRRHPKSSDGLTNKVVKLHKCC